MIFLHHFVLAKLASSSIRVNVRYNREEMVWLSVAASWIAIVYIQH